MNIIDIGLGFFLLIALLIGLKKGLIASIIHLVALVCTFILITKLSPAIAFLLHSKLNLSELVAAILSYLIILIVIIILAKITVYFLHKVIKMLKLTVVNRILGAIFGFCNGILILVICLLIISISPFQREFDQWSRDSQVIDALRIITNEFNKNLPELQEKKMDGIDELIEKQLDRKSI